MFSGDLREWQWLAIFVARLSVGLMFFLSGSGKLFVRSRREEMRQTILKAHIPFAEFNTIFVSSVEFFCGALLLFGALTSFACLMLGAVMAVALVTTSIRQINASSLVGWLSEFLYLPEVHYLVILFWIFLAGPGRIDRLFLHCPG